MRNIKSSQLAVLFACLSAVFCSVSFGFEATGGSSADAGGAIAAHQGDDIDRASGFGYLEKKDDCQISTKLYFFAVLDRFGNAARPGCFYRSEDNGLNKDCRPDNGFGKDVRSLPNDWSGLIDTGVTLHACTWNVPGHEWNAGFPFPLRPEFYDVRDRNEWFALRYQGEFEVTEPGAYEFRMTSDDGSKLIIDDYLVIENDHLHAMQEAMGLMDLAAGVHTLDLQYFQGPRTHLGLVVEVRRPGSEKFEIFDARFSQ